MMGEAFPPTRASLSLRISAEKKEVGRLERDELACLLLDLSFRLPFECSRETALAGAG